MSSPFGVNPPNHLHLFPVPLILPFLESQVHGIAHICPFETGSFPRDWQQLSFNPVVACIRISLFFMAQ